MLDRQFVPLIEEVRCGLCWNSGRGVQFGLAVSAVEAALLLFELVRGCGARGFGDESLPAVDGE